MIHVLIVEDEERIAGLLDRGLRREGFTTEVAADADAARRAIDDADVVLLDLNLPDQDGMDLLVDLRSSGARQPVLIVSGRDGVDDRVQGLEGGADDFIGKPFAIGEIAARIRARLRATTEAMSLSANGIDLDLRERVAVAGLHSARLSAREASLLEALMATPDGVQSRDELQAAVWPEGASSNVVDVYVRYLRKKLGDGVIETVRGSGYRLGTVAAP